MTRTLPYAGIDAAWEARQLQVFQHLPRNAAHGSFADFVFGRLLEDDLHVSCSPMLPPNVDHLHNVTIQGMCILQIVDIVNIGANFEHRKEDAKGPTRTLKICFTDGHQLVCGFEYRWLPSFSMALLHGTKVAVMNVDVRHGLLMLTPQNCRLLGLSGNELLEQARQPTGAASDALDGASAGAYSAALMTTQFTSAPSTPRTKAMHDAPSQRHPPPVVPVPHQHQQQQQQRRIDTPASHPSARSFGSNGTTSQPPVPAQSRQQPIASGADSTQAPMPAPAVTPPVFVDVISSDDDCDSDATDPMVYHLFYSPNTPRIPDDSERRTRPRKRPRDSSSTSATVSSSDAKPPAARPALAATPHAGATVRTPTTTTAAASSASSAPPPPPPLARIGIADDDDDAPFGFALLGPAHGLPNNHTAPPVDPKAPFQYFSARQTALSAADNAALDDVMHIRACIKSVAGFQFQTGLYDLQVLIEDCSETKQVSVDAAFVEQLMGVSCLEFLRAMQTTPHVAHQWAARMQFALMTLEGVMAFRLNPNGTVTLLACRDVTIDDARTLLQRVQATLAATQ